MFYKYVLAYLRLSRDDEEQQDESNSIKNQRLLIQQFIKQKEEFRGSHVLYFSDDGFSGTSFSRPDFKRMMEFVRKEESCCIIVKDLSRLGRDTIDCQRYVEKVFPFLHVRFIAINDFYDSDNATASGKDTEVKFKNLVNGIYPQICSKNIKQVLRKQAEMGKYHGAVPPFGYRFPENCRTELLLDEEAAEIVKCIFEWYLEGRGTTEIARQLNAQQVITPSSYQRGKGYCINSPVSPIWSKGMVLRLLANPLYTGTMVNHKTENQIVSVKSAVHVPRAEWICVPDTHEAIVSQEDFDAATAIRNEKNTCTEKSSDGNLQKGREKPILSGKIRCGHCHRKVRIRAEKKIKTVRFYCSSARIDNSLGCYAKGYGTAEIEEIVLALIKKQAALAEDTIKAVKQMSQTLDSSKLDRKKKTLEEKAAACRAEKMELYEKYIAGGLSKEEYLQQKGRMAQKEKGYKEQAEEIDKRLSEYTKQKERSSELKGLAKYVNLDSLSRGIVEELVDTIYFYDPEHIEVIWRPLHYFP